MNGAASELILGPGECTPQPTLVQKYRSFSAVEPCSPPAGDWGATGEEEEEEEEGGRFLGVSMRKSGALRGSVHIYDSFRRHSWEPGKVLEDDPGFDQCSVSLKGLSPNEIDSCTEQLGVHPQSRRDPRRAPIVHRNDETESLLSQDEEDDEDHEQNMSQGHLGRMQSYCVSQSSLSKSVSMSGIDSYPDADVSLYADDVSLANGFSGGGSCGWLEATAVEPHDQLPPQWEGTTLGRTLSFFKKMTGKSKVALLLARGT
ncbi:hypothetical protein JRQ81_009455 [Phrynocephalus forsythii]|uniref:Uncharacterized protein n=1 Tax=Phrynocephalus forsythii TaxID=171643 RepID=A0A9Q0XA71_9SAUR|nr:hypothetical protein JRQ81_009455 [Phrynocephalus forsythii]